MVSLKPHIFEIVAYLMPGWALKHYIVLCSYVLNLKKPISYRNYMETDTFSETLKNTGKQESHGPTSKVIKISEPYGMVDNHQAILL